MRAHPGIVPPEVLGAFGVAGRPAQRLAGGEGRSIRVGELVLKPVDDPVEAAVVADLLCAVDEARRSAGGAVGPEVRVPLPVRSVTGAWVVAGWAASAYLEGGVPPEPHWPTVLAAGRAFHRWTAMLPARPWRAALSRRAHRWAVADRAAWDEREYDALPAVVPLLHRARAACAPVGPAAGPDVVVHGDLSGNVLVADGAPPAVLDVSPYVRPAGYADAVVAADALLWHAAAPDVVALARGDLPADVFDQLLLRAWVFRLLALDGRARVDRSALDELPRYDEVLVHLLRGRAVERA